MKAFLAEETVQCEFGDDILRLEECVYLHSCEGVETWILVDDEDVLEYEGGEWLEVDFFKCHLTLDLFRKAAYDSFSYGCLHLRKLYRK